MFHLFLSAPEGVLPPVLLALSSSVLQVSFAPPLLPQGNITMYAITRSSPTSPPQVFSFPPSPLPQLTSEGVYVFNDTGLRPFTNYSYVLRVCTGGGCTDSRPSVETTLEDTPTGVVTPTTAVISFSEIRVEWAEPSMPSGVIQSYDLFRVSIGFESDGVTPPNCCDAYLQGVNPLPNQCSRATSTTLTSHLDTDLDPFTFYAYCLVATNNADSGFSGLTTPTQTSPAPMPLRGPVLNATALNSTAVFLEWDSLDVSELLGPLQGYTVYARVAGTPGLGEVLVRGVQEEQFVAGDLQASTEYVFVVLVSNGVGATPSNNATATTAEGSECLFVVCLFVVVCLLLLFTSLVPVGLPAPSLEAERSDAIAVFIFEPVQPNGEIILYNIIL